MIGYKYLECSAINIELLLRERERRKTLILIHVISTYN